MFKRQHSSLSERNPLRQIIDHQQLQQIREAVMQVHASDNILDYLQRLVAYTRNSPEFEVGLSPRGGLALLDCARTWAVMSSRGHIVPEDLQRVLPAVAAHRLVPSGDYAGDGAALVTLLQRNVDVIRP
jgi:MoxR-like ATPase